MSRLNSTGARAAKGRAVSEKIHIVAVRGSLHRSFGE